MPTIQRLYDAAKGLWYQDIPGKGRVYDSPAAYGASKPDIGGGLIHKSPQWDQSQGTWDAGIDWGKLYTYLMGAGLGIGGADALGAFGAGGASGTAIPDPAASYGGIGLGSEGAGAGVAGANTGGAIAAGAGAVGSGSAPAVGTAAGSATSKALTSGQKVEGLLAGLGGLIGGKVLGDQLGGNSTPPELQQLLQLALERAKSQQPLFNQINSGVSQMLPNFASKAGLPGGGT